MVRPSFIAEADTRGYVLVHPKVVRDTGSANNALVYIRTKWRCGEENTHTWKDPEGRIWWVAEHVEIGAETGLTAEQVAYALNGPKGLIAQQRIDVRDWGKGRPKGYRVPEDSVTPPEDSVTPPDQVPEDSVSLLTPELEASGGRNGETRIELDALFDRAWIHWPKKVDKKDAREKFERVVKANLIAPQALVSAIIEHGQAHAQYTPTKFVRGLAVWLNKESWHNPLPEPEGSSMRRQDDQLALIARLEREETQHALES